MSEKNQQEFQTFGNQSGAGICGPNGCSIADYHKQAMKNNDKKGSGLND